MGNACLNYIRRLFSKKSINAPEETMAVQYLNNRDGYFTREDLLYLSLKYPQCKDWEKEHLDSRNRTADPTSQKKQRQIKWKESDVIGNGSFGRVVLGLNLLTGELMAVKQVHIGGLQSQIAQERIKALELEVELLSKFNHKNIVRYIGTNRTKTTLNIFLEYVSGGTIASLVKKYGKLNETLIRLYLRQILEGLEYLHARGTIHRDIKGANVLVDNNGICKLADFGSAKSLHSLMEGDSFYSLKGTANWMAPEVIMQKNLSRFSDIWSIGCMVIEMATGKPPWHENSNQISMMFQIAKGKKPPPMPTDASPECIDFLKLCLRNNSKERPNVTKLLQHRYLRDVEELSKQISLSYTNPRSGVIDPSSPEKGKFQRFMDPQSGVVTKHVSLTPTLQSKSTAEKTSDQGPLSATDHITIQKRRKKAHTNKAEDIYTLKQDNSEEMVLNPPNLNINAQLAAANSQLMRQIKKPLPPILQTDLEANRLKNSAMFKERGSSIDELAEENKARDHHFPGDENKPLSTRDLRKFRLDGESSPHRHSLKNSHRNEASEVDSLISDKNTSLKNATIVQTAKIEIKKKMPKINSYLDDSKPILVDPLVNSSQDMSNTFHSYLTPISVNDSADNLKIKSFSGSDPSSESRLLEHSQDIQKTPNKIHFSHQLLSRKFGIESINEENEYTMNLGDSQVKKKEML